MVTVSSPGLLTPCHYPALSGILRLLLSHGHHGWYTELHNSGTAPPDSVMFFATAGIYSPSREVLTQAAGLVVGGSESRRPLAQPARPLE